MTKALNHCCRIIWEPELQGASIHTFSERGCAAFEGVHNVVVLPALPAPPESWIKEFNEKCRNERVPVRRRELFALEEWARKQGQNEGWKEIWWAHHSSPACGAIYTYLRQHTAAARKQDAVTLRQSCFFYDEAFWRMSFTPAPEMLDCDPMHLLSGMPDSLRVDR